MTGLHEERRVVERHGAGEKRLLDPSRQAAKKRVGGAKMQTTFLGAVMVVASVGLVPVEPWTPEDETLNLYEIFNALYETEYVTNRELEPLRIEPAQRFQPGAGRVTAEARSRFAGHDKTFGYYVDTDGGEVDRRDLFTVTATGILERGEFEESFSAGDAVGFYMRSEGTGQIWHSDPALNDSAWADEQHLIVYNSPEDNAFLLVWEEHPYDRADLGFTGLAVELHLGPGGFILPYSAAALAFPLLAMMGDPSSGGLGLFPPSFVTPGLPRFGPPGPNPRPPGPPQIIPEPDTIALFGIGFACLGAMYVYRRRREQA